jgi:hypothetical protein
MQGTLCFADLLAQGRRWSLGMKIQRKNKAEEKRKKNEEEEEDLRQKQNRWFHKKKAWTEKKRRDTSQKKINEYGAVTSPPIPAIVLYMSKYAPLLAIIIVPNRAINNMGGTDFGSSSALLQQVGWLVGWLGCSAGWLTACLVGLQVGRVHHRPGSGGLATRNFTLDQLGVAWLAVQGGEICIGGFPVRQEQGKSTRQHPILITSQTNRIVPTGPTFCI